MLEKTDLLSQEMLLLEVGRQGEDALRNEGEVLIGAQILIIAHIERVEERVHLQDDQ